MAKSAKSLCDTAPSATKVFYQSNNCIGWVGDPGFYNVHFAVITKDMIRFNGGWGKG